MSVRGLCGHDHMVVGFTMQRVPIATEVVSSNPAQTRCTQIQYYVIKFVSDLRQVGGFLWVLWFPPPITLAATI